MFAWTLKVFSPMIMNQISCLQYKMRTDKNEKKLITRNSTLKNQFLGGTCYILGNGPALKKVDLTLLKNKTVFSVNSLSKHPLYSELKSSFHIWADPGYFNGEYETEGVIREIKKTIEGGSENIRIFLPTEARAFLSENHLDIEEKISWFKTLLDPHKYMNLNTDITKPIAGCRTVVQLAIICALHMGFRNIYLLGCDGTSVLNDFQSVLSNTTVHEHFYSDGDQFKEKKKFIPTSEYICYAQYRVYLMWRKIYEYCKANNIEIHNVVDETLIDSVPTMSTEMFGRMMKEGRQFEDSSVCSNKAQQ